MRFTGGQEAGPQPAPLRARELRGLATVLEEEAGALPVGRASTELRRAARSLRAAADALTPAMREAAGRSAARRELDRTRRGDDAQRED